MLATYKGVASSKLIVHEMEADVGHVLVEPLERNCAEVSGRHPVVSGMMQRRGSPPKTSMVSQRYQHLEGVGHWMLSLVVVYPTAIGALLVGRMHDGAVREGSRCLQAVRLMTWSLERSRA